MRDVGAGGRDAWPATRERRGGVAGQWPAARGAGANGAMVSAVSYFSFCPRLARGHCGYSCPSGQTRYRNSTELVPTGRNGLYDLHWLRPTVVATEVQVLSGGAG